MGGHPGGRVQHSDRVRRARHAQPHGLDDRRLPVSRHRAGAAAGPQRPAHLRRDRHQPVGADHPDPGRHPAQMSGRICSAIIYGTLAAAAPLMVFWRLARRAVGRGGQGTAESRAGPGCRAPRRHRRRAAGDRRARSGRGRARQPGGLRGLARALGVPRRRSRSPPAPRQPATKRCGSAAMPAGIAARLAVL